MASEEPSRIAGIPRETCPGERRVAAVPAVLPLLAKAGIGAIVEAGAGEPAGFADAEYRDHGARIAGDRREVFAAADLILQVRALGANPVEGRADIELLRPGQIVVGFLEPLAALEPLQALAERGVAALAMELIPRTTRAQSMDALSSMATIAGYRAVLIAAHALPKLFPMLMTAAGTITAARVLVMGAGVAGLQAIATARRLGAVTSGYDIRPAAKEQVQSLGAKFVELPLDAGGAEAAGGYAKAMGDDFYRRQQELLGRAVAESDVVITTAAVPGKRAPVLVTAAMVEGMRRGSVIVDLAAERGGNCALTRPGETIVAAGGVTIIGPVNAAAGAPFHASQMYAKNVAQLVLHIVKGGAIDFESGDEILRETLVVRDGRIVNALVRQTFALDATEGKP